jgi:D-serine deaminase-like pyridoxal phosphate-dependent protein
MISSRFARLDPADFALPPELMERLLSPSLVIDLDRVRQNVRRVISYAGGKPDRWRPHIKTSKIPELLAELVRAGMHTFKCATTREAACMLQVLDDQNVDGGDLLLAHPLVGPGLTALGRLALAHPRTCVAVLCEDEETPPTVPAEVSVFVDINPGMNRTGVPLDETERILGVARAAGGRFRGLHFYDGHVRGSDPNARREMAHEGYRRLVDLALSLRTAGLEIGEVVTSGTPSFLHAVGYPGFAELMPTMHRISPGTVVLHDLRSEQELDEIDLQPAAVVLARVVSHPAPGIVTCDAGSKSLAAEAGDPSAFVLGHPELEPLRPSEEHLPLRVHAGAPPPRGTPLLLVPRHVCPTVNLAEEAVLLEGGKFGSRVAVRARAHGLFAGDA